MHAHVFDNVDVAGRRWGTEEMAKSEGAREVAVQSCPQVENLSRPSATKGDAVKHDGGSTCLAELRA